MPKVVPLQDGDLDWLRDNHETTTLTDAARRMGMCVDTLKRLLVREGLRDFPGAKYQTHRNHNIPLWTRKCITCASQEERPRGWYFCRPCRSKAGYDDE